MSHMYRRALRFIGCMVALALAMRLVLALPTALFGSIGGLADVVNELSIVVALLATYQLSERRKKYYPRRAALSSTEAAWMNWLAELEASKRMAVKVAKPLLKNVA